MNAQPSLLAKMRQQFDSALMITATSPDRPAILGGSFGPERLAEVLAYWRQRPQMPWRIWEYVHTITFADTPGAVEHLLRADLFGEGGHVALRRDGGCWLWHAVGPRDMAAPACLTSPDECADFWTSPQASAITLRRYEEIALLWGAKGPGANVWYDDRVGGAQLVYPQVQGERVRLRFWRFTEAGQTAFVWYRGLEDVAGEEQRDA